MRSIMISIQPKWCDLIFRREKTREVRKTLPDADEPFKAYIYATKKRPNWVRMDNTQLSGMVVGEFIVVESDKFFWRENSGLAREIRQKAALTVGDLKKYAGDNDMLYAWHISALKEYDEPIEIGDFLDSKGNIMTRAPQSWQYVTPRYFMDAKAGWNP